MDPSLESGCGDCGARRGRQMEFQYVRILRRYLEHKDVLEMGGETPENLLSFLTSIDFSDIALAQALAKPLRT